jgi:hypothetical protein
MGRDSLSFLESRPVKMGPTRCPQTSVNNYHTTPCNYPKDHRLHQHRGGSLKSKSFSKFTHFHLEDGGSTFFQHLPDYMPVISQHIQDHIMNIKHQSTVWYKWCQKLPRRWYSIVNWLSDRLDNLGFESWQRHEISLFSKTSKLDLGRTQPPVKWVPVALSSRVKWLGHEADYHLHLLQTVTMGVVIPPIPHTPSWHVQRHLYLYNLLQCNYICTATTNLCIGVPLV